jgi:hypothetical protein
MGIELRITVDFRTLYIHDALHHQGKISAKISWNNLQNHIRNVSPNSRLSLT